MVRHFGKKRHWAGVLVLAGLSQKCKVIFSAFFGEMNEEIAYAITKGAIETLTQTIHSEGGFK